MLHLHSVGSQCARLVKTTHLHLSRNRQLIRVQPQNLFISKSDQADRLDNREKEWEIGSHTPNYYVETSKYYILQLIF
jgi:hypothetical protein